MRCLTPIPDFQRGKIGVLIVAMVLYTACAVITSAQAEPFTITEGSLSTSSVIDFIPRFTLETPSGTISGGGHLDPSRLVLSPGSALAGGVSLVGTTLNLDSTWVLARITTPGSGIQEIGTLNFDTPDFVLTTGVLTTRGDLVASGFVQSPFQMTGSLFGDSATGTGLVSATLAGGTVVAVNYVFGAPTAAIPEPSTGVLCMAGVFGLAWLWRRRATTDVEVLSRIVSQRGSPKFWCSLTIGS